MKVNSGVRNDIQSQLNNIDSAKTDKVSLGKNKDLNKADKADTSSSAKVNLSEKAQMMSKAMHVAKNTEVDNDEKVQRLQKLIDAGDYKVSADKIADKLVDEHLLSPS